MICVVVFAVVYLPAALRAWLSQSGAEPQSKFRSSDITVSSTLHISDMYFPDRSRILSESAVVIDGNMQVLPALLLQDGYRQAAWKFRSVQSQLGKQASRRSPL